MSKKHYIDTDVYTEAKKRIKHIIDIFDNVVVCFSGGKDSLCVLNLVQECYDEMGITQKVKVIFRDEELIPDDNANELLPVFVPYEVDKEHPRVEFRILNKPDCIFKDFNETMGVSGSKSLTPTLPLFKGLKNE